MGRYHSSTSNVSAGNVEVWGWMIKFNLRPFHPSTFFTNSSVTQHTFGAIGRSHIDENNRLSIVKFKLPSSVKYKPHLNKQFNCWSLRCSWSIACRRCSNYIFILNLTPGFNGFGKYDCKTRWESFKFWDLVRLILDILRYVNKRWPVWLAALYIDLYLMCRYEYYVYPHFHTLFA